MPENHYTVYMHRNKTNGKIYVGSTRCTVARRWQRGWGYRTQPQFYNAIQSFGWDSFEHIVLFENLTKEQAFEKETELIEQYDSRNPEHGYNLTAGGYGTNGWDMPEHTREAISQKASSRHGKGTAMFGKHHTAESRQKMKENNPPKYGEDNPFYGKHHSQESIDKMRKSAAKDKEKRSLLVSGKNNPMYGKHHTDSARKKMSGKKQGGKHPNSKKVVCIETGIVYSYVGEASKKTGISPSGIAEAAREFKPVRGVHWKYVD